jgi:CMP-N-acetylneuraminic acid synthetase
MSERTQTVAVIPARAGSKRVPNKNLREVNGKPLIAHTIQQAKKVSSLDRSIVSTESEEIRAVSERFGADVPFERPQELATDTATSAEVVFHALEWLQSSGASFDHVCLLPVTTPFRSVSDIESALSKLRASEGSTLVSVTDFETPPFWTVEDTGSGLQPYFDKSPWDETQSQEFPSLIRPNGAIFAAQVPTFMETKSFYTENTVGYKMPRKRSLDIDEPFDLELARALMSWRKQ